MKWHNNYLCGDCDTTWNKLCDASWEEAACPSCGSFWGPTECIPKVVPGLFQGKQIVRAYIEPSPDGDFIPGNPDNPKDTGTFRFLTGQVLKYLHTTSQCQSEHGCVIHNQSNHHMRGWVLYWCFDHNSMRRVCPHNVGHPDPDDRRYWESKPGESWRLTHNCDCGCCNG